MSGNVERCPTCAAGDAADQPRGVRVERRYVDYDFHQEREALLASDMPGKATKAKFFE